MELARRTVTELQATTDRHEIQIEATERELVGVLDASRLQRVLANLLSNAIKFTPEGGPIGVALRREENASGVFAVLEVSDKGLGIPSADLPHLFEHLHRGANVAATIPGSGIGLASVRQIVDQHGGTVSVRSQEGQGSTFTVRLPTHNGASS